MRVKVYIDGFNLYHAIDEIRPYKAHLKWVDLWGLSESLIKPSENLVGVEYFSAFKKTNIARFKRHEQYVAALEYQGVSTNMGKFKQKKTKCMAACKQEFTAWEEKETDVHIAVKMVEDAFTDQFDKAILITADTDLIPPMESIRSYHSDKVVVVIAPPKRKGRCRALNPIYEIPTSKINQNLLPENATDKKGKVIFQRPQEYTPPPKN